MSRTQNLPTDQAHGPSQSYLELSRMLEEGRSWSGRERNVCFLNLGAGRFADISAASGFDFPDDSRAVALTDWDHDGDLDLWVSNRNAPRLRLLRNSLVAGGRTISLRLVGDGVKTSRDAIGARIEVVPEKAGRPRLSRTLRAGDGFLSQSSRRLLFGLGEETARATARVQWPGGVTEEFRGLESGKGYDLVEGAGQPALAAPRRPDLKLDTRPQVLRASSQTARLPLVGLFPMTRLSGLDRAAQPRPVELSAGKPTLIILWASWCAPCVRELEELVRRRSEIETRSLAIAALNVNGLGGDRASPEEAFALLDKLRWPYTSLRATDETVRILQHLHDTHVPLHLPLPVPSSFLVDARGRLQAIYKGPVDIDALLRDAAGPAQETSRRLLEAAAFPGSMVEHPVAVAARATAEASTRFQLAFNLESIGHADEAEAQYRSLLEQDPQRAEAYVNLGLLLLKRGAPAEARSIFEAGLARRPDDAALHHNLGAALEHLDAIDAAAAAYQKAIDLDPRAAGWSNALGVLLARAGRMPEARAAFEREIALRPADATAHNHLGLALLQAGDLAAARKEFEEALRLDPALADAHNNLGAVASRERKLDEALAHFKEAERLSPEFVEAINNLGRALLQRGDVQGAKEAFQRCLRIRPDFEPAQKNLQRIDALLPRSR